ncbi:MAG: heavy metal translocating P-type ATPase, partial [Chloroflexota bacterium]
MTTNIEPIKFRVEGMTCSGCVQTIENAVGKLTGIEQCELNFTTEIMRVQGTRDEADIKNVVRELGFGVVDETHPGEETAGASRNFWHYMWQRLETRLALCAAVLIIPGLVMTELLGQALLWVDGLSLVALLLAGWPIAKSAWVSLRIAHEININVLMTIAAIGAVIIGAYVEAAMVMVLFAMGEALESYTAGRARNAIRSLMQVAPNVATRLRRQGETVNSPQEAVDVNDLAIGDLILIRPGDRIPMDGQIIAGHTAVDQAAITGESRLIEKAPGDDLFAGSINSEGAVEVEVTRLAADNTISRMIRLVEEAQEKRAPAQRFVDQFAKYYTPTVVVLAALTAIIPPLFFGQPFFNPNAETFGWLYRGLTLLVVACPCALVISTPVSIISAISNAARHGVLVKGGVHLEKLSQIQAIAFDKTGTLTQGKPSVVTIRSVHCEEPANETTIDCMACEDVLALASAVEARSEHPFAHAVTTASAANGLENRYLAENVSALTGRGVSGTVNGRDIFIGSHSYFDANVPHNEAQCEQASSDAKLGRTPLMVGINDSYAGTITVADTIRTSSQQVIEKLKTMGLHSIVMLTGDETATAQKVGAEIGVTDVRARLLPEDKVSTVEVLQAEYGALAMVGDGINDAPALATADIGIAMGGAGSTAQAMETADITLMNDDLRQLPFALRLSRATMNTIRANVIFSIGIK